MIGFEEVLHSIGKIGQMNIIVAVTVLYKPVSIKCRLQTADCRLQTGYKMQARYKMQTETKTASSSNTGYILNFST